MRKSFFFILSILLIVSTAGIGMANEPDGNDRKGKYTYKKVYKACAQRGEVDSSVPPLSPDSKTMAQWKRLFEKKDFEEFLCKQEWSQLSEDDIADIYAYLYKHAADSPSPAKCK
jgi:hypothetical protein